MSMNKNRREDNRKSMNKKWCVRNISGILEILAMTIVALGVSATGLHAQAPAAGPPPLNPSAADLVGKTAEQYYKKIEVLKGIPADQVHPAMEYITTALGVGCGYCHVAGHFDQDDKREKHVARSMMQMTMALNETVFNGKRQMTCYTCHRGAAKAASTLLLPGDKEPTDKAAMEIFPALAITNFTDLNPDMSPSKAPATVMSGPAPARKPAAAPAEPLPSVAEVFSKYEEALGGQDAVSKIKTLSFTGTVDMLVPPPPGPPGGPPPSPPVMGTVPAEHYVSGTKGVISWSFPGRPKLSMGFNGTVAWHQQPNREETGDERLLLTELGERIPALEFREEHTNVQVDAMEKIGDRDTYRVVGTRKEGFPVIDRVNFDAQTGLLVHSYTTMQSVLGSFPEEAFYEDYRDVSGVKIPFTNRVASPEGDRTYKWAQVDVNAPVDEKKFERIPPPPPRPAAD